MDRIDALVERLGLPVRKRELIVQALTHASWLHEHPGESPGHNERLEFLGDAVISLAISQELFLGLALAPALVEFLPLPASSRLGCA